MHSMAVGKTILIKGQQNTIFSFSSYKAVKNNFDHQGDSTDNLSEHWINGFVHLPLK